MTLDDIAEAVQRLASKATYGGGTVAVLGGLTANEVAAYGGLAIGVAGFFVNWVYKHKHFKLAQRKGRGGEE